MVLPETVEQRITLFKTLFQKGKEVSEEFYSWWTDHPETIVSDISQYWNRIEQILNDHIYIPNQEEEEGQLQNEYSIDWVPSIIDTDSVIWSQIIEPILEKPYWITNGHGKEYVYPHYYFLIRQFQTLRSEPPSFISYAKIAWYAGLSLPFLRTRNYSSSFYTTVIQGYKKKRLYDIHSYINIIKLEQQASRLSILKEFDDIICFIQQLDCVE